MLCWTLMQVCEDLKIQSQNDEKKLEEAKGMVYLKGFTDGVMTVGTYAGEKVSQAKAKIRQELLDAGQALVYSEPEGRVMSRSGDECVVALTDQWCVGAPSSLRHLAWRCCVAMLPSSILCSTSMACMFRSDEAVQNVFCITSCLSCPARQLVQVPGLW